MYHAMGYSSILVMQAAMTFEPKDIDTAMTSLRESLQTCQRFHIFLEKKKSVLFLMSCSVTVCCVLFDLDSEKKVASWRP